jgi:hypothetical protein
LQFWHYLPLYMRVSAHPLLFKNIVDKSTSVWYDTITKHRKDYLPRDRQPNYLSLSLYKIGDFHLYTVIVFDDKFQFVHLRGNKVNY